MQYSQPEEYRFSHDSVFLARQVFELERERPLVDLHVLDLCAGCGIVGLDFLFHSRKELGVGPRRCDFVEVQTAYAAQLAENCRHFPEVSMRLLWLNYNSLLMPKYQDTYDLIEICNGK